MVENETKFVLPSSTIERDDLKSLGVESGVFEEDCGAGTEYVLLVDDKAVVFSKGPQIIVVHHSLPQEDEELLHIVDIISDAIAGTYKVSVGLL